MSVFPGSRRQGCFPHLVGATVRPGLVEDELGNLRVMSRSGIICRLYEALVDKDHLEVLKSYIFFTRHCPRGLFASLWHSMIEFLEAVDEKRAVRILTERYLFRASAKFAASVSMSVNPI